jgi:hypothetical protein
MSNNGTRPRPRPKTVEEWKEARRDRYRSAGDKGGFRLLPVKVLDSDAFNELSKSAKLMLILSVSQLDYWQKKHRGLPRRDSSVGPLRNDGRFSLPNNLLIERGIKGTDTIARIRKELVATGFWETVQTGSLFHAGVFRWSDNWLRYNQKSLVDRKQCDSSVLPAGFCHYPNIVKFNQAYSGRSSARDSLGYSEEAGDSGTLDEPEAVQLELFPGLVAQA